jgi:hypothetical protein
MERRSGSARHPPAHASRPKLLDEVRRACHARQFSDRTAEAYSGWVRRYVLYHGKRHPSERDGGAVSAFLTHFATVRNASASTQRQAASAILFLYSQVLELAVKLPSGVARPTRPRRLPIVLSRGEVLSVLNEMHGLSRLVANLLYGAGLRLMEALSIRIKDLSFDRGEIVIRSGKGGHDRVAILPDSLKDRLLRQADRVRVRHLEDVRTGGGWVNLPGGLLRVLLSCASGVKAQEMRTQFGDLRPASPLYGMYDVVNHTLNGESLPPLYTDTLRWRRVSVSHTPGFTVHRGDDSRRFIATAVDENTQTLQTARPGSRYHGYLRYSETDEGWVLSGQLGDDSVLVVLRRAQTASLPLLRHKFRWIREAR